MEKKKPETQEEKIDAILRILQGEPLDPNDNGLMGTMHEQDDRLTKIETWKTQVVAWIAGLSFGGGALMAALVSNLLHKK